MTRMTAMALAGLAAALAAGGAALAQRATEVYIPIGKSPGVSDKSAYVAEVQTAPAVTGEVTARAAADAAAATGKVWKFDVDATTKVYLDRSAKGLPNIEGKTSDITADSTIEVKIGKDGRTAEWVKVAAP